MPWALRTERSGLSHPTDLSLYSQAGLKESFKAARSPKVRTNKSGSSLKAS